MAWSKSELNRVLAMFTMHVMTLSHDHARAWLATHELAFNTGNWDPVLSDYADDAVLEVHIDGDIVVHEGLDAIRAALYQGSATGIQTRVERVVAADDLVAAQICDEHGATFMTSFWHVLDGRITRDVSVLARSLPDLSVDS